MWFSSHWSFSYSAATQGDLRRGAVRRWTCDAPTHRRCYVETPRSCAVTIGLPCSVLGSHGAVPRVMTRVLHSGTALARSEITQNRRWTANRLGTTQSRSQVQDGHQIGKTRSKSDQQSSNQRRALCLRLLQTRLAAPGSFICSKHRAREDRLGPSHDAVSSSQIRIACDGDASVGISIDGRGRGL